MGAIININLINIYCIQLLVSSARVQVESRWSPRKYEISCVKLGGLGGIPWIPPCPPGFHPESIWNPSGIHLESIWNPPIIWLGRLQRKFHLDSTWSPCVHVDSRWNHLESMGEGKVLPHAQTPHSMTPTPSTVTT